MVKYLLFGNPEIMSAKAAWGIIDSGGLIKEIWLPKKISTLNMIADRIIGIFQPKWSLHAAKKKSNSAFKFIPPFSKKNQTPPKECDRLIVSSFPYKIPKSFYEQFKQGAYNIHPSLLPAYKGAHPLFWMIYNDRCNLYGGITVHKISEDFDTGEIITQTPLPLGDKTLRKWQIALAKLSHYLIKDCIFNNFTPMEKTKFNGFQESYFPPIGPGQLKIEDPNKINNFKKKMNLLDQIYPFYLTTNKGENKKIILKQTIENTGNIRENAGIIKEEITSNTFRLKMGKGFVVFKEKTRIFELVEKISYFFSLVFDFKSEKRK